MMNRLASLVLAVAMALTLLAPPPPADAATSTAALEDELVRILNRERASHGLPALRVSLQQQRKAREHSERMRAADRLFHPADLGGEVFPRGAWSRVGENAARSRSVDRAHTSLMSSPPHRSNILGDWTHVAVGIAVDGGDLWVTQRFVTVRSGHALPMFTDMPTSPWKRETVVDAWRRGLLAGCGGERVCADGRLNRAQMASLLARASGRDDDASAAARFRDVPTDLVHAGAIGALAADGVTLGCRSDRYCPNDRLSRAATASLIVRARGWGGLDERRFEDVMRGHTHARTINRLSERAITDGCSETRYCPSRPVSRVEAARMLARAF
jgi:hypothetical protein